MISADNKNRILSVVNIFETGTPDGEYDDISIFNDGTGGSRQITYGRSQTTEQGNLKKLIEAYIANKGMFLVSEKVILSPVTKLLFTC